MMCQRCGLKLDHGVGSNHRTVADCIEASRQDAQRRALAPRGSVRAPKRLLTTRQFKTHVVEKVKKLH